MYCIKGIAARENYFRCACTQSVGTPTFIEGWSGPSNNMWDQPVMNVVHMCDGYHNTQPYKVTLITRKLIAENKENNGMQLSATTNWISLLMCNLLGIGNLNTTNTGVYMLHTYIIHTLYMSHLSGTSTQPTQDSMLDTHSHSNTHEIIIKNRIV